MNPADLERIRAKLALATEAAENMRPIPKEAFIDAFDLRTLLDALEHEQQGHVLDFLELKAKRARVESLEDALRAIIVMGPNHASVNRIARAALLNEDKPNTERSEVPHDQ